MHEAFNLHGMFPEEGSSVQSSIDTTARRNEADNAIVFMGTTELMVIGHRNKASHRLPALKTKEGGKMEWGHVRY